MLPDIFLFPIKSQCWECSSNWYSWWHHSSSEQSKNIIPQGDFIVCPSNNYFLSNQVNQVAPLAPRLLLALLPVVPSSPPPMMDLTVRFSIITSIRLSSVINRNQPQTSPASQDLRIQSAVESRHKNNLHNHKLVANDNRLGSSKGILWQES